MIVCIRKLYWLMQKVIPKAFDVFIFSLNLITWKLYDEFQKMLFFIFCTFLDLAKLTNKKHEDKLLG